MSKLLDVVSGWTGTLDPFTLRSNGVAFPGGLDGFTVEIVLHDYLGNSITPGGTVTVDPDQVTNPGVVRYAPAATDFVFADDVNYPIFQAVTIHWKVTDGAGKVVYFPNSDADTIDVYKP